MKHTGSAAVLGALSLLATACGGAAESPSGGSAAGGTFTYALRADPGVLDPAMGALSVTNTVLSLAYDTLTNVGPDGKIIPGLAEKWDVKPDSVTFTLRKDVTCSDGSKLTPADVAANIDHITDPAAKSPINGVLVPAGMKAEADDAAGTVTLSTPKPFSFILESTPIIFIVCGKGLKDRSALARGTSGSGPYTLTEAVPGDHYTFRVREDYAWGPGGATTKAPGQPATVVLKVVPNEQTAANLLVSGDLNGAMVQGSDRARLEAMPGIGKSIQSAGNGQFFYHQGDDRPAKDPAVRKALTQAINLTELAGIASGGTGRPATGLVLEPRPCRGDTVTGHLPAFDPAAAAAALDAAGWKAGADGVRAKDGRKLTLRLLYGTTRGAGVQAAAEYLAAAWKKAGADVTLNGVIDTKLSESLATAQDWDVAWLPIGVTLPTQLVAFLSGPAAPKGSNFAHLTNTRYEELVTEAVTKPGADGCKLWLEAESALFENADLVPVVENTTLVASRNATFQMQAELFSPTSFRMTEAG
ncbi:peptide/nickel transport system substrate-binding protein [Streptosporangium becharense]|uniref:Peptide/nickel transport system substrate-binding protein n=1 Tax=Streptosporangium becharense TaxID=1816182 RepID=A0A7W9IN76_9ACTN|nr:ABC transporter substrate-binding protein [Streptosporangium becharense]MBB2914630.1 peptide/nickel transport system substrate-binding protein [Streptosporangium becharense]MBB5823475.1 peptide/nickel transport system substrate-binding protein [Streptosporangium becharense]